MSRVVFRVRAEGECFGRLKSDGGAEVANGDGDRVAVISIARVSQQTYSRIRLTLDRLHHNSIMLDHYIKSRIGELRSSITLRDARSDSLLRIAIP